VLAFPPGLDFLVAFLACQACSVVAVPYRAPDPTAAGPRFAEERAALFDVAAACGARVALTSESYAAAFKLASVKLACSLDSVGRAFRAFRAFRFVTKTRHNTSGHARVTDTRSIVRVRRRRSARVRDAGTRVGARRARETRKDARRERKNKKNDDDDDDAIVSRSRSRDDDADADADDSVAFVQFTSGSTGTPKGVVVGVTHVRANCALIRARLGVTVADSNVSWLPQFHDMGLVGAWLVPLTIPGGDISRRETPLFATATATANTAKRATGVFYSPVAFARDPASWMRVASDYGATMTQGPDFAYRLCAMRFGATCSALTSEGDALNLSLMRSCLNASERAQPDTHALFAQTFARHGWRPDAMRAGYGLAESVVYVCDGPVRVARVRRSALETEGAYCLLASETRETRVSDERAADETAASARGEDAKTRTDTRGLDKDSVLVSSCGSVRDASRKNALDPDVRVVCPETRAELPDGRVGEIWVRGGSVAFGYVTADGFTKGGTFGRDLFLRGDGGEAARAATPRRRTGSASRSNPVRRKRRKRRKRPGTSAPATRGLSTASRARCSWSGACATVSKSTDARTPRRISNA
jgi:acyl-CoA synthetase (AMP-forming)/AMP-acid ligase II